MTASLLEREVVAPVRQAEWKVRREDIEFKNIAPNRVRISVTVANPGDVATPPTIMLLQAAPLGAFVAWQNLTIVSVPTIGPHESVQVTADVDAPTPKALGDFSRVPPRRLLTAIGAADDSPAGQPTANPFATMLNLLRGNTNVASEGVLPDDPLALLTRPNSHWAGNINVLIGQHAVERHLARALRIYAGRPNLAMFFVGDRPDEYRFELTGSGTAWNPLLFDFTDVMTLLERRAPAHAIAESKWIKMSGGRVILLAIEPPEYCSSGEIEVHVRQRSSDREAVVEFSLDPHAAGPGCYAV